MSNINDNKLDDALQNFTVKILKNSSPYITKESISRRVLQECAEILNIDLNCYTNKNIMYIHPDNMDKIDLKWQNLTEQGTKIVHDELNTYKLLKSSDFVNILDVQKFINILASKNENDFCVQILAMDGFNGVSEHKNYVENLKFGNKNSDHVQVIRDIYQNFHVPVKVVYFALLKIFEDYTMNEVELQKFITEKIDELSAEMEQYDVDSIIEFYKNAIDLKSLEQIASTKLIQLKNQKKKSKATKRKLKIDIKKDVKKEKKKIKSSEDKKNKEENIEVE